MQSITKETVETILSSHARAVCQTRVKEPNSLGIQTLYNFIQTYLKVDPNILYFTPRNKLSPKEEALLLLLQCFDERNDKRDALVDQLNELLMNITNEE